MAYLFGDVKPQPPQAASGNVSGENQKPQNDGPKQNGQSSTVANATASNQRPDATGAGTDSQGSGDSDFLQKLAELKIRNVDNLSQQQALDLSREAAELSVKFMEKAGTKGEKDVLRAVAFAHLDQAEGIKNTSASEWHSTDVQNLIDLEPLDTIVAPQSQPAGSSTLNVSQAAPAVQTSSHAADIFTLVAPTPSQGPTRREEVLLWRGSRLAGGPFPPWDGKMAQTVKPADFVQYGNYKYTDSTEFSLSKNQLSLLEGWKRPSRALPPPSRTRNADMQDTEKGAPTMRSTQPIDLVQDAASNCSVVASMCSAMARTELGYSNLINVTLLPWDDVANAPSLSGSGRYVLKFNFNGCFRKVVIDDRLPVSRNDHLLHVIDRNCPELLWPALVEKAYMKVRGGFDFPGSNSCTDLWTLTGWVPEQCHLQHDDIEVNVLWKRMSSAFAFGDVLVTIGTGKLTPWTEEQTGLVSEHAYAVIAFEETNGKRKMLIKNPWVNGATWKQPDAPAEPSLIDTSETASIAADDDDDDDFKSAVDNLSSRATSPEPKNNMEAAKKTRPGTFWMDLADVMQNFDTIYLNWNPGLFEYRRDVHFEWDLTSDQSPHTSLRTNPQYAIHGEMDETVWILLSKHFKDARKVLGRVQHDVEFISLYAYNSNGERVMLSKGPSQYRPYIDSQQVLLKLDVKALVAQTVVVVAEGLVRDTHTFTLSAFARHPLTLTPAKSVYSDCVSAEDVWTKQCSGISTESVLYRKNIQYILWVPSTSTVSILLETVKPNVSVNVRLFHSQGKRLWAFKPQDMVAESHKYRSQSCVATTEEPLPAGFYTAIVSTHEHQTETPFKIHVYSHVNVSLNKGDREGAGRIRHRLADVSFPHHAKKIAAPVGVNRLAKLYIEATLIKPAHALASANFDMSTSSPVRISVEIGKGPDRRYLMTSSSGMFKDAAGGVRTEDFDISPEALVERGRERELWLVLERMGGEAGGQTEPEERFMVDVYADVFNWATMGVWRQVE